MKNIFLRTVVISAILLIFIGQLWSQETPRPEIIEGDLTSWNAVYPLRSFDYAGCGYSLPRKLIVKDKSQSNFIITFEGGKRAGGVFATNQCSGFSGYVARKYLDYPNFPTQLSDTITATFSRPLTVQTIRLKTKTPATYRITLNDSISRDYQVPPRQPFEDVYPYKFIYLTSTLGFSTEEVKNITKLSITSLDSEDWSFAVDSIGFENVGSVGGETPPTSTVENPVIFVPGVGGSELVKTGEGIKWLPISLFSVGADINSLADISNNNPIYASDVFRGIQPQFSGQYTDESYKLLLNFLKSEVGKEYIAPVPIRRTTDGCDLTQDSTNENLKPKLFVFPYDWRQSNVINASALKDYIGCIKRFHPNKKVDIITHSMGGLLARRYILDNPNDTDVDKLITITAPWLGAPRAIHSLETGGFIAPAFGSITPDWIINKIFASNLRNVIEKSPGPLQLLPSRYYFDLYFPKTPFSRQKSPWSRTNNYNYSETRDWLNDRHPIRPGNISRDFHNSYNNLQDNWKSDTTNTKYYHIYGQQRSNITVGQVDFIQNTLCTTNGDMRLDCVNNQLFLPQPTNGDGTVPLISSRRVSQSGNNLNSLTAKRYFEDGKNIANFTTDDVFEHTKITQNPKVHERILRILTNQPVSVEDCDDESATRCDNDDLIEQNLADGELSPSSETSSFYVSLHNIEGFHAGGFAQPTLWGSSGLNGMQAVPMNDKSAWIAMPAIAPYKVSFFGDGTPIKVQIIKGLDYDRIEQLTGYIDLIIPVNAVAELIISPFDNPQLRYDSNGDGFPDTLVSPTLAVTGENASDIEPPVVSFDYQSQGAGKIVTLTATDDLSGVRKIYYSFDGQQFSEYTTPVLVGGGQNEIYVFAEDNNFNRTGISPIDLVGTSYSIGNRVWFDINNDGRINNEIFQERGIDGVSVSLFADDNGDGQPDNINQPLKTTTTDSEGYYRFDELNAGNYVVRINPSNFADNAVLAGYSNTTLQASDDTDSDATFAGENGILPDGQANNVQNVGVLSNTITLGPDISEPLNETDVSADDKGQFDGYANLTVDFGFYRLGVSGTVWSDSGTGTNTNNGIFDDSENGLANFRIRIFQANSGEIPVGADGILGTPDDAVGGVLTDENGNYSFQGLAEGDYIVKVERQSISSSSIASNNPNDNVDFDNNGSVGNGVDDSFIVSHPVSLTLTNRGNLENTTVNEFLGITDDSTLDFGLLLAPTAASVSISGSVINLTGVSVSGARVNLLNSATNEITSVLTNSFGYFNFDGLPVGDLYIITVQHKEYNFAPRTLQPMEDVSNLLIMAEDD